MLSHQGVCLRTCEFPQVTRPMAQVRVSAVCRPGILRSGIVSWGNSGLRGDKILTNLVIERIVYKEDYY